MRNGWVWGRERGREVMRNSGEEVDYGRERDRYQGVIGLGRSRVVRENWGIVKSYRFSFLRFINILVITCWVIKFGCYMC